MHAEEGAIHLVLPPRASRVQLAFELAFISFHVDIIVGSLSIMLQRQFFQSFVIDVITRFSAIE